MEEEALKLKELQSEVDKQIGVSSPQHLLDRSNSNTSINLSYEEKVHADFRNKLKYLEPIISLDGELVCIYYTWFSNLKVEVDARSCYVGNVDYGATAEELEQHFHGCGSINRVTILCNKFDGNPKGFAYVEFTDKDSVDTAMALDDSLFRGRQIKVNFINRSLLYPKEAFKQTLKLSHWFVYVKIYR